MLAKVSRNLRSWKVGEGLCGCGSYGLNPESLLESISTWFSYPTPHCVVIVSSCLPYPTNPRQRSCPPPGGYVQTAKPEKFELGMASAAFLDVSGPYVAPDGPNDENDDIEQNAQWMIVVKPTI